MKDWTDLEVTKRALSIGTAGILDAPDFDIPPFAEGTAVIRWRTGPRTERPLKDGTLHITSNLTVEHVTIDEKSIQIPEPDPTLFDGKKDGDVATVGEAVAAVAKDIGKKRGKPADPKADHIRNLKS